MLLYPLAAIPKTRSKRSFEVTLLLGANLGKVEETFANAVLDLARFGLKPLAKSKVYRSKPWGIAPGTQALYRNQALLVQSPYHPLQLLRLAKALEQKHGRSKRYQRYAPRALDIDLLTCGHGRMHYPDLGLPHALLFKRKFALVPLAEVWPKARTKGPLGKPLPFHSKPTALV